VQSDQAQNITLVPAEDEAKTPPKK